MVKPTVDNTPVTVLLDDDETFTPATGNVIKAFIQVPDGERIDLQVGSGPDLPIIKSKSDTGNGDPIILTDSTTVSSNSVSNSGVYISGFVVN
jgi:hypothetical protein